MADDTQSTQPPAPVSNGAVDPVAPSTAQDWSWLEVTFAGVAAAGSIAAAFAQINRKRG
jgi:hypothetical protein